MRLTTNVRPSYDQVVAPAAVGERGGRGGWGQREMERGLVQAAGLEWR